MDESIEFIWPRGITDIVYSENKDKVFIVFDEQGYGIQLALLMYDFKNKTMIVEDKNIIDTENVRYPSLHKIFDNNYLLFSDRICLSGCGPLVFPEKLLYSMKDKKYKNIGKITDFEWSGNGAYKYKEYIPIPLKECADCLSGECGENSCYKDPKDLLWKYGKF